MSYSTVSCSNAFLKHRPAISVFVFLGKPCELQNSTASVSYTHLDVYKRQSNFSNFYRHYTFQNVHFQIILTINSNLVSWLLLVTKKFLWFFIGESIYLLVYRLLLIIINLFLLFIKIIKIQIEG